MVFLKTTTAKAVLCLTVVLLGGMIGGRATSATGVDESKDAKLKALVKERLATLQEVAKQTKEAYERGGASLNEVHDALHAVLRAELDACDSDKERITVLEKSLAHAKEWEKQIDQWAKTGQAPARVLLKAKVYRLETEIALERERNK